MQRQVQGPLRQEHAETGADARGRRDDGDLRRLALENEDLRFENEKLRAALAAKHAELGQLVERNLELGDRLAAMTGSTSWRFTGPIRAVIEALRRPR